MSPAGAIQPTPSTSFIKPQVLMTIRNLELRARVVVQGFWSGIHRSPHHGFSVEFTEYRQYVPGDDPRYLDWRVFARSDRYFIKRFEDETNLRCQLVVDGSRSMTFGSIGFTKAEYAATLAASLAQFLFLQGDAVGLLTFDQEVREYLPARHRTGQLRRLMLALEKPAGGQSTDLAAGLRRIAELVPKRGLVVVISDFLAPLDAIAPQLSSLGACGHDLIVFHLVDPAEATFSFPDAAMFQDAESGQTFFVDPAATRKEYLRNFEAHLARLRGLCQRLGAAYQRMPTDRPLESALFDFVRARMQIGRRVRRIHRQRSTGAA